MPSCNDAQLDFTYAHAAPVCCYASEFDGEKSPADAACCELLMQCELGSDPARARRLPMRLLACTVA